jgi:DNA-binding transcriptional regulator PaaX
MQKKPDFTRKILNSLSGKKAVGIPEIQANLYASHHPVLNTEHPSSGRRGSNLFKYAITRSIKNLADSGLVELLEGGQGDYLRLTKEGRMKASSQKLDTESSLVNPNWDGKWRIILLDLPESRKAEREALRYILKKAGFILLKNSAWVSPFPFEFLFQNLKKDFGLSTELMIIVTDSLDEETEKELKKEYAK